MTRKHFKELARIAGLISDPYDRSAVTAELVQFCLNHNRRFDPKRFRQAVAEEANNHQRALNAARIESHA